MHIVKYVDWYIAVEFYNHSHLYVNVLLISVVGDLDVLASLLCKGSPDMVHCLTLQLLTRLGGYNVWNLTYRNFFFEGSGDENTVLVMEGSLPLTVNSSILGVFEVEGVPSGYFNFTTPPKLVVYIPSGTDLSLC